LNANLSELRFAFLEFCYQHFVIHFATFPRKITIFHTSHFLLSPPRQQYAQLVKQGKDKSEQRKTASPTKVDIYETELSAFHRQKKQLADTLPADQKHLLNGLLFYRVRFFFTAMCFVMAGFVHCFLFVPYRLRNTMNGK
jgi:hypothetical protein